MNFPRSSERMVASASAVALFMALASGFSRHESESSGRHPAHGAEPAHLASNTLSNCGTDITECRGLLDAHFFDRAAISPAENAKALDALNKAQGYGVFNIDPLKDSKAHKRQACTNPGTSGKCPEYQRGWTKVNKQARDIHLEQLTQLAKDKAIIIGAIRFKGESPPDRKYGVGDDMDVDDESTTLVLVAYALPALAPPSHPPVSAPIARWTLFQRTKEGTHLDSIKAGIIMNCLPAHHGDDANKPESYFMPCGADRLYGGIAQLGNVSFSKALDLPICSDTSDCTPAERAKVAAFRQSITARSGLLSAEMAKSQFDSLYFRLTRTGDPTFDSYWFTCASGCCTADM